MPSMKEAEFLNLIDCKFPYSDRGEASRLIKLACEISANCAFAVAEEVARPGNGVAVNEDRQLELLAELSGIFSHPLKESVFKVAEVLIRKQEHPIQDSFLLIDEIAKFPGQYSALNIVYFATNDSEDKLDDKCELIKSQWTGHNQN